MLKAVQLNIEDIYVPLDRRKELKPDKVEAIAEEIMSGTEERPIHVRRDKNRYVLLKGVNRLEARKALGETSIQALILGARLH